MLKSFKIKLFLKRKLIELYSWMIQLLEKFNKNRLINLLNKSSHQYNNSTSIDRYPEIFNEVKEVALSKNLSNIKILSFGCSTGEECISLLKYFPDATIVGTDINPLNLRVAKKKYKDLDNMHFYPTRKVLKNQLAQFDLVFCMSVLCRWKDTMNLENCEKIYPFPHFEKILIEIDKTIKKNGLLVIYNSNYRFSDTTLSVNYKPLNLEKITESGFVHKFDRHSNRLLNITYPFVVFEKLR